MQIAAFPVSKFANIHVPIGEQQFLSGLLPPQFCLINSTNMKTTKTLFTLVLITAAFGMNAQVSKPTITVLNIDSKGISLDPEQLGNLTRIELEKLDTYSVTDRYDVAYLVDKNKLNITNCYGKMCLLEIGNTIKTDYIFTGSVEIYGQTIIVTLRLIDVKSGTIEKTQVEEFLNLPLEIQQMLKITIRKMFKLSTDDELVMRLTKKFDFDNAINNPNKSQLNLSGPRFGYVFIFGDQATRIAQSTTEGGYEAYPAMFQFGYQFEKQYLNEGNYQALFEVIPVITGVDQQMLIPSVIFLNGFRDNKHGWEIAIGPSISINKYSELAEFNGKYYTAAQMRAMGINSYKLERTIDKYGDPGFSSALILAFGKTVKSGKMNIPLNLWASIPTREGFRIGISVGYNSKK
jgi:hypothetical protein